ncbi:MAG: hypothetical protein CM15mP33_01470 [Candidatus Neomarinimicrobiota bacterium]|nr:MAG: hypothetical protein CM15mP33_01470 [Candidatus Neomarinimicrobiota bacterium]
MPLHIRTLNFSSLSDLISSKDLEDRPESQYLFDYNAQTFPYKVELFLMYKGHFPYLV